MVLILKFLLSAKNIMYFNTLLLFSVSLIIVNVYSFKSSETVQQFYKNHILKDNLNKKFNEDFCRGSRENLVGLCEIAFEYLGAQYSEYRHFHPHYPKYKITYSVSNCKEEAVYFKNEAEQIIFEHVGIQLMAECIGRRTVLYSNENIYESMLSAPNIRIYIMKDKLFIFKFHYNDVNHKVYGVPFEYFTIYRNIKPIQDYRLFIMNPPVRLDRIPAILQFFKNELENFQNMNFNNVVNLLASFGAQREYIRKMCILALETKKISIFRTRTFLYAETQLIQLRTITYGLGNQENYITYIYLCPGYITMPNGTSVLTETEYAIAQGMNDETIMLLQQINFNGIPTYVPMDLILNVIPEVVDRVFTYDGLEF